MTIDYTNLFEDVGEFVEVINSIAVWAVTDLPAHEAEITTQLNLNNMFALQSGIPETFSSFQDSIVNMESSLGGKINQRLVDRDTILDELPVGSNKSVSNVLSLLYRQMIDDSASINGNTVTIGASSLSLVGLSDGVLLTSSILDGVSNPTQSGARNWFYLNDLDNVVGSGRLPGEHADYVGTASQLVVTSETMTITCESDSESNGTIEGGERFRWKGEVPNSGSFDWKVEGSGSGPAVTVLNGQNFLVNGEFENWASSAPSNWTIDTGVAGADILEETSNLKRTTGTSALRITRPTTAITGVSLTNPTVITAEAHGLAVGDIVTLALLGTTPDINGVQTVLTVPTVDTFTINVNVTATSDVIGTFEWVDLQISQSMTQLTPGRRYCVGVWVEGEAGIAGSSALTIQLEGTNYTAGTVEKISLNAVALAAQTAYGVKSFFFNAPVEIPSDFELVIKVTGSLTATKSVYIDGLALGEATYFGDICVGILAGATPFINGDKYALAVSNNDVGVFQKYFRKTHKVQLVSDLAGGESIPDTLATD